MHCELPNGGMSRLGFFSPDPIDFEYLPILSPYPIFLYYIEKLSKFDKQIQVGPYFYFINLLLLSVKT